MGRRRYDDESCKGNQLLVRTSVLAVSLVATSMGNYGGLRLMNESAAKLSTMESGEEFDCDGQGSGYSKEKKN